MGLFGARYWCKNLLNCHTDSPSFVDPYTELFIPGLQHFDQFSHICMLCSLIRLYSTREKELLAENQGYVMTYDL